MDYLVFLQFFVIYFRILSHTFNTNYRTDDVLGSDVTITMLTLVALQRPRVSTVWYYTRAKAL